MRGFFFVLFFLHIQVQVFNDTENCYSSYTLVVGVHM